MVILLAFSFWVLLVVMLLELRTPDPKEPGDNCHHKVNGNLNIKFMMFFKSLLRAIQMIATKISAMMSKTTTRTSDDYDNEMLKLTWREHQNNRK